MGETILLGLGWIPQSDTPPLRTKLHCTALRFVPRSIMKGRGELSRVKMNAQKRRP